MRIAFASAALLATQIVSAATPIPGWYSSVFGGYAYLPNNISNTQIGQVRTNASYNGGYDAGGSIGFKSEPMRYEGELTYIHAKLDRFNINNIPQTHVAGYGQAVLAMANIYYDFPDMVAAVQPFLGVGLGYAWVDSQLNSEGPFTRTQFSASSSAVAYQATAGLTFNYSENYAFNVGYRYVATTRIHDLGKVFQANLANVGVVYRFDEARYK